MAVGVGMGEVPGATAIDLKVRAGPLANQPGHGDTPAMHQTLSSVTTTNTSRIGSIGRAAALLAAAGLLSAAVPGCRNRQATPKMESMSSAAARDANGNRRILVDGEFTDWPAGKWIVADSDYVYFRVRVEGGTMPLQAANQSLALWLDADGDASTGAKMPQPPEASRLGVDLAIEFSPITPEGGVGRGSRVVAFDVAGGERTEFNHPAIGLSSGPTFATDEFEVRIERHSELAKRFAKGLGSRGGTISAMFVLTDATGTQVGWSDPDTATLPPASKGGEPRAQALVPAKAAGSIRVMSYNVLKSSLVANPQPFARIFQVVKPDVVLLQEWETDAASAAAWFTSTVGGTWQARAGHQGVVVVTPHSLAPIGPDTLVIPEPPSGRPEVRFIGAAITTPAGVIDVGSLHLKCCGTAGSSEDIRRDAEAKAINAAMKSAMAGTNLRVIGGDFNLVGSRAPLDDIRADLDTDGSELSIAPTRVLGDGTIITWTDDKSEFPPGRLDYIVYSDAAAELTTAFVLDTRHLSDRALATMGLNRDDTAASDHLPVVVDVRAR